jgi:hypothetical protein
MSASFLLEVSVSNIHTVFFPTDDHSTGARPVSGNTYIIQPRIILSHLKRTKLKRKTAFELERKMY